MAGWTAANAPKRRRPRDEVGGSDNDGRAVGGASSDRDYGGTATKRRRRSAETTEAALARLSSSYNAAITAVGALHRASAAITKTATTASASTRCAMNEEVPDEASQQRGNSTAVGTEDAMLKKSAAGSAAESQGNGNALSAADSMSQLCRVAKAARKALGHAILLDPLVRPYAPTWYQTMKELGHEVSGDRVEPAALTSSAHKATVKELAYLVLVNYGDLLTCGCFCNPSVVQKRGILDKGIVKVLGAIKCSVGSECSCCWAGESEEDTKRLALVAYCDASDLDRSDPTLWLKIACAARALGKTVARRQARERPATAGDSGGQGDAHLSREDAESTNTSLSPPPPLLSYHRLERYALESGLSCLAPGIPPNRTIVRALRELQVESDYSKIMLYPPILRDDRPILVELVIDLPRYSWSTLGRALMKACREGSAYCLGDHGGEHIDKADKFGSPSINVRISPMLTLPPAALGTVCEFLGSDTLSWDVKSLESTCRALSVEIISARAAMEKERHQRMLLMEQEMMRHFLDEEKEEEQRGLSGQRGQHKVDAGQSNEQKKTEKKAADKKAKPTRSHRSSKRVLSQLITSGKQAERTAKRKSVEYCLISVIFSCTAEHPTYKAMLEKKIDWSNLAPLCYSEATLSRALSQANSKTTSSEPGSALSPAKDRLARRIAESSARNGTSSLQCFIVQWSKHNSGPIDTLSRFLSHVSWHVDEVFSSEKSGMMVLSSCVMDCFDLLTKRCGYRESLAPCWYGKETCTALVDSNEVVETFAINLLNAELRLRRCERHGIGFAGYEDDTVCVSFMVPKLVRFLSKIKERSESMQMSKHTRSLEIRCHWLAGIFYTWLSRRSAQLTEIREAEATAMRHIDEAIKCLAQAGPEPLVVSTPHLGSPGRSGSHWKELSHESVSAFRNELQASLVVSRARQRFHELKLGEQDRLEGEYDFSRHEREVLNDIGNELLERYDIGYEGLGGKHEELMTDFLTYHGTDILSFDDYESNEENKASSRESTIDSSSKWGLLWNSVPSSSARLENLRISSDPSLISILIACLLAREDSRDEIILSLLTRLVSVALDQFDHLSRQGKDTTSNGAADDDSSVSSSGSEDGASDRGQRGRSERGKWRSSVLAARFLMDKLADIVLTCSDPKLISGYAVGTDFIAMMHKALLLSAGVEDSSSAQDELMKSPPDFNLFLSTSSLISAIFIRLADDEYIKRLRSSVFASFVEIFVKMRRIFPVLVRAKGDCRLGRTERQTVCLAYAEYVSAVVSELAGLLARDQSTLYADGQLEESYLIKSTVELRKEADAKTDISPIVQMTESLLWFWKYIVSADVFESTQDITSPRTGVVSANSVDRAVAKCLVVPIAACIISLCGASGHGNLSCTSKLLTNNETSDQSEQQGNVSLSDFCDTDDSANGWYSEEGSDNEKSNHTSHRSLLRMLIQSIQCCGLIFTKFSDTMACSNEQVPSFAFSLKNGPLLPVVVVRTLTHIADVLLIAFGSVDVDRRGAVWAELYPFGARSAGLQLDSLLHKAYRCLHGFALVGQNNQVNSKKDLICPSLVAQTPLDSSKFTHYAPESPKAAAQLYRCIRRAYPSKGRRSPPKAALECVSSALPPAQETQRSKAIRSFLFGSDVADALSMTTSIEEDEEDSIFGESPMRFELLRTFPQWVLDEEQDKETGFSKGSGDAELDENQSQSSTMDEKRHDQEEIRHVRKGICEELAQGSLPRLGSGTTSVSNASPTKDDDQTKPKNESVERESTAQHEKALYRKFRAILDYLCYEPMDSDAWYRAGLCLGFKADIICDRLTSLSDSYKGTEFVVPVSLTAEDVSFPLPRLLKDQKDADREQIKGWVPYIGKDLSHYIRYPWATLSTLRSCSKKIKETCLGPENDSLAGHGGQPLPDSGADDTANRDRTVWDEIDAMFENGYLVKWEKAWGGMFIAALHSMAKKCFSTALHLSTRTDLPSRSNAEDDLFYELAETTGTSYYAELMGSTRYGYPTQHMTDFQKRRLAKQAKAYFRAAIEFATSRNLEENIYDLYFMIGKCEEKIAKTLHREAFVLAKDDGDGNPNDASPRAYERIMRKALASYATGVEEVKKAEKVRNLPDVQAGGSSHGIVEIVYRLHASRLKVLLSAVKHPKESRETAELEALRITRDHWYVNPNNGGTQPTSEGLRDGVWEVLADVVGAMAQLRIDNQFFHRSVYRHSQALLWAPVLHDPESGFIEGSLGSVPATKSYHLRGLNTGACVNSAEAVINALFDKKRQQLCGVWVATTATPSPFEVLNDAVRKYDALRSKYVGAYIDIMRLCKRKDALLTFLGWTDSSQRDLPAFYEASAALRGAAPDGFHTRESLLRGSGFLWTTKRRANSAIADILLRKIAELGSANDDVVTKRMDILKDAYSCFLRMNCPVSDKIWRSEKIEEGKILEVEAMCKAYDALIGEARADEMQAHETSWESKMSLLQTAVEKCQEMFPTMGPVGQKKRVKRKFSRSLDEAAISLKRDSTRGVSTDTSLKDSMERTPQSLQIAESPPAKKFSTKMKRKAKMIVVDVPAGLAEGDTFEHTFKVGGINKKVKLTVPAGNPSKLKFKSPRQSRSSKSKGSKCLDNCDLTPGNEKKTISDEKL